VLHPALRINLCIKVFRTECLHSSSPFSSPTLFGLSVSQLGECGYLWSLVTGVQSRECPSELAQKSTKKGKASLSSEASYPFHVFLKKRERERERERERIANRCLPEPDSNRSSSHLHTRRVKGAKTSTLLKDENDKDPNSSSQEVKAAGSEVQASLGYKEKAQS